MEKKLRIQLFDEEGRMIGDRTVSQDPEFSKGPLQDHFGLFRIEFTLDNKDDVEKAKIYLDQMVGSLPLDSHKSKKKKGPKIPDDPLYREGIINNIVGDVEADQDQLISYLRDQGFVFRTWDFLESMVDLTGIIIKDIHKDKFQFMLREIRKAKNPKADKYDPMLIFGIKLDDERTEKVVIYLNGEFNKSIKIALPEKPKEVYKKTTMLKFPHFMTEDERTKFTIELRSYESNKEKGITKFFNRWMQYVDNLPKLENPNPNKKDQD